MSSFGFYVKLYNIASGDETREGHRYIEASSGDELLTLTLRAFHINESAKSTMELWSSNRRHCRSSIRLDTLPSFHCLPVEYPFVWLYAN